MNSLNVDETNPIIKSNSSEVETIYDTDNGDWEEMMNGNIFKKIIKQGTGETASMGTIVKCNLKGYIQDITNSSIASDNQPFEILKDQMFKIGESDAFPGLELTLRHAKVGEIFIVRCSSRFGFGPVQRPEIKQADGSIISTLPADSDLKYEVEVYAHVNFAESIDPLSVSPERDIALAESTLRKDCGNRWFSYADFNRAGRAYSKGVEVAEGYLKRSEVSEGDDRSEQPVSMGQLDPGGMLMNMYITCMNNLAATLLSKGEYLKAKEVCMKE